MNDISVIMLARVGDTQRKSGIQENRFMISRIGGRYVTDGKERYYSRSSEMKRRKLTKKLKVELRKKYGENWQARIAGQKLAKELNKKEVGDGN